MRKLDGEQPRGFAVELVDEELAVFSWDLESEHEARSNLTDAECDVLRRVAAGATNREIARARGTSERTVANQVAGLLRKLDAPSRFDLVRRFGGGRAPGPA